MGALVRELLIDYAENKLGVIEQIDIDLGVRRLIEKGLITPLHVHVVALYSKGYTIHELRLACQNVDDLLVQFYFQLADEIHYDDETVIQRGVKLFPEYTKAVDALRKKMEAYARSFE